MLKIEEIKQFLDEDMTSELKRRARTGEAYYNGEHDILQYRMFYFNAEGKLVEDKYRANNRIPHPFFTELVDQGTQYVMSGAADGLIMSKEPKLQKELDIYFNKNKKFKVELSETITGQQVKGFDYMYAYKGKDGRLQFENADCLGVVEVEGRFAADGKEQRIYKYLDRIDKDNNKQWKILVIDDENTYYYKQADDGQIELDSTVELNPRPHAVYQKGGKLYKKTDYRLLPFFRLDYNKKRISLLKPVKPLIDDYDLMASSLSNNLVDFDTPIHVVKGFNGDNLDELQRNIKTKKLIGVDEDGGLEIKTVDVPYQARKEKLELDKEAIFTFGMGFDPTKVGDGNITNVVILSRYTLLDLKKSKFDKRLKKLLKEIIKIKLAEINQENDTDYQLSDIEIDLTPDIPTNETENIANEKVKAETQQLRINTILNVAANVGDEPTLKAICDELDLSFEELRGQLEKMNEAQNTADARAMLGGITPEDEGAALNE